MQYVFRAQEERSFERDKWTKGTVIEKVLRADYCLEESRFLVCLNLNDFFVALPKRVLREIVKLSQKMEINISKRTGSMWLA